MWHMHSVEYYSVLKREIMPLVMNLEHSSVTAAEILWESTLSISSHQTGVGVWNSGLNQCGDPGPIAEG